MGILEIKNVNKSFGGLHALSNVNLSIKENTIHAIIGPNGAGKSTLLNCLIGRLAPDSGEIMFAGRSLLGSAAHEINQIGISRVFQTPEIFNDLSVLENVTIPCLTKHYGVFVFNVLSNVKQQSHIQQKAMQILDNMGIADQAEHLAGSLSRGDKRRLELAMCLVQNPKLLLLDEPTAGMARADTNQTIDLLCRIQADRSITMAIIEHDMHVVFSLAKRITVLAQGTPIVEDTPENIKGNPKVQEAYLGSSH